MFCKGVNKLASIRKRGKNSYQIIVSCGYNINGKKLIKTKTVKRPANMTDKQWEKELNKLVLEFEMQIEKGVYFEPSKFTVSDLITKWLEKRGKDFAIKTLSRYESMLNGRIKTALGHLKLEQIKPLHLLDFYSNLQESGIREDTKYIATPDFKELINSNKINSKELAAAANMSERTLKGVLSGKSTTTAYQITVALKKKFNTDVKFSKLFTPASPLKPLSNKTIQHYHRVLSVMFNDAVSWGIMKENPCSKVKPPKVERKEMQYLDEKETYKLLKCLEAEDIKTQTLFTLALVTGCRRGELCGLQWEHIDLDKGLINIKQSATYTAKTGIQIKQPKTTSSIRTISIPNSTIQLLKKYRKWWLKQKISVGDMWQKEDKERLKDDWKDPEWVFTTWNGYIMHPDSLTAAFKDFLRKHELPNIRLHDLRHTAATMLVHAGLNVRAIASRLGHANPNVTLSVYSHTLQSADKEAANMMENLINKNKSEEINI